MDAAVSLTGNWTTTETPCFEESRLAGFSVDFQSPRRPGSTEEDCLQLLRGSMEGKTKITVMDVALRMAM